MDEFISTGSDTLNEMLCGDQYPLKNKKSGIKRGNIVLIRGEPGSGKTTLAMQILSAFLNKKEKQKKSDMNNVDAVLFSYEEEINYLIDRLKVYNFFGGFKTEVTELDDPQYRYYSWYVKWYRKIFKKKKVQNFLRSTSLKSDNSHLKCITTETFSNFLQLLHSISKKKNSYKSDLIKITEDLFKGNIVSPALKGVYKIFNEFLRTKKVKRNKYVISKNKLDADLIILDSLNAYQNIMQYFFPSVPSRQLLNNLCQILRENFGPKATIILTGEHHYHPSMLESTISESFFSDIEIILRPEPIRVPANYEPTIQTPVGYNSNALIGSETKSIESRSFCRVLKSRSTMNQSRRCTYDIVTGKGLQFYDTYPGDGKIVLFKENIKQEQEWSNFFKIDVPESYPALRHEVFDRMSMQTIYEGQRRLRNIPLKTDMYISSFDCYWVSWYRNYKLKSDIDGFLEEKLEKYKKDNNYIEKYSELVNKITKIVKEDENEKHENSLLMETTVKKIISELNKFSEYLDLHFSKTIGNKENLNDERKEKNNLINDIMTEFAKFIEGRGNTNTEFSKGFSSFLRPINFSKLKLFGEKRSEIIDELMISRNNLNEHKINGTDKETKKPLSWLSIPYDANISFFIYRQDVLEIALKKINYSKLKDEIDKILANDLYLIKTENFNENIYNKNKDKLLKYCIDNLKEGGTPQTWEEIIAICNILKKKTLIEVHSFNTYLCTILEMIWNCGAEHLEINADYQFNKKYYKETKIAFIRAFNILKTFYETEVIEKNSSLETKFPESEASVKYNTKNDENWLFARHWYSTFIDNLTAKNKKNKYVWCNKQKMDIGIMPIPTSMALWLDRLNTINDHNNIDITIVKDNKPINHSCWGEWSFGVLAGTENMNLAIDLINNIMSSANICKRAFKGACIPTVKDFYDMYGNVHCFNIPERTDITLPDITYKELKDEYFTDAKTRLDIYDFRHFAKILHAKVELLRKTSKINNDEIIECVQDLFMIIKDMTNKPVLL